MGFLKASPKKMNKSLSRFVFIVRYVCVHLFRVCPEWWDISYSVSRYGDTRIRGCEDMKIRRGYEDT